MIAKLKLGEVADFAILMGWIWVYLAGGVVADGVEVSEVRENIRQPAVDAALHQLRVEQG